MMRFTKGIEAESFTKVISVRYPALARILCTNERHTHPGWLLCVGIVQEVLMEYTQHLFEFVKALREQANVDSTAVQTQSSMAASADDWSSVQLALQLLSVTNQLIARLGTFDRVRACSMRCSFPP